jgi:IS5 family transposase
MEETLHYMALFRVFAQLDAGAKRLPGVSTILRFHQLLEANNLDSQIQATVNVKLIDRGLIKKTAQLATLFTLSNLLMVKKRVIWRPAR